MLICWNRGLTSSLGGGCCWFSEQPEVRGQQGEDREGAGPCRGCAGGPLGTPPPRRLQAELCLLPPPQTAASPHHPLRETLRGTCRSCLPQAHCSTSCLSPQGLRPPPQAGEAPRGAQPSVGPRLRDGSLKSCTEGGVHQPPQRQGSAAPRPQVWAEAAESGASPAPRPRLDLAQASASPLPPQTGAQGMSRRREHGAHLPGQLGSSHASPLPGLGRRRAKPSASWTHPTARVQSGGGGRLLEDSTSCPVSHLP